MDHKPFFPINNSSDEFSKFSLFVKTHEIKEISRTLEYVSLLPKRARKRWLKDNASLVQEAFDDLIDDSNEIFEEVLLDDETLKLSEELITSLREAVTLMEGIMGEQERLIS